MSDTVAAAVVGAERTETAFLDAVTASRMSATLDRDDPPFVDGDALPHAWHWLHFLASPRASELAGDGRGGSGDLVPGPLGFRRMWAGGSFAFMRPLRIGDTVTRRSRIQSVDRKEGRSGPLVLVSVEHRLSTSTGDAVVEHQELVFRQRTAPAVAKSEPVPRPGRPEWSRVIIPDEVMLFRMSALTFNGHRIHYDRRYAVEEEGYPDLVVHGPLTAILLLDLLRREVSAAVLTSFAYRATAPLFVNRPITLCGVRTPGSEGAMLWAEDQDGRVAMRAEGRVA